MPTFSNNTGSDAVAGSVTAPDPAAGGARIAGTGSGQSESVVRSAGVVSIAVLMSRVTGLVRESVMARLFGAGLIYDAFMLGFRIPNLTRDLFAEGALSSAFVPTFTEYLTNRGKDAAARLVNLVATALILVVGAVCALGVIFAPQLVHVLAPGYAAVPGKFELAVRMTRIMFPFLLLVALAAQAMGVLNASNKFGVPALASTFFNLGSVGFGVVLGIWLGPSLHLTRIEGMAIGVVLGGALQLAWQLPSLYRLGFHFRAAFDWKHPGLSADLPPDGPGDSGQRGGADQRDGEYQLRFYHCRSGARHGWPGQLAELCVPLHAASARPVRRGDGLGDSAVHLAQRRSRQHG